MNDGLKAVMVLTVVIAVIFGGLGMLMVYSNEYQCNKYHEATGREIKMVAQTCYTKVQGEWYPTNQVRAYSMIETLVKPQKLDNDVAVVKILQLMGQLSPNDIAYVLKVSLQVYKHIITEGTKNDQWVVGKS